MSMHTGAGTADGCSPMFGKSRCPWCTEPSCVTAHPNTPELYDVQSLIAHYREHHVVLFYDAALTKAIDASRIYTVQN